MKRVLQIASGLHKNGTETFMMNVYRNIDRRLIQFDFLVYEPTSIGYEEEARELGARIFYYTPRKAGLKKHFKSLDNFFRLHAKDYSAVHYNGNSFSSVLPLKMAKNYGIPVRIAHSHNSKTSGLHNKFFHKWNKRNISSIATHYFACSQSARDWGFKNTASYDRSIVIPNGINLEAYRYNPNFRDEIRKELNIDPADFVICHTGAFRPVKNHRFIIEIFRHLREINKNARLLLCGTGETENEIKGLVDHYSLENAVYFLGVRNDINKILCASDAYLFPSLYEGLPFALIEAQTSGINIFASDRISKEIKLTDKIEFISLELSAYGWTNKILSTPSTERNVKIHNSPLETYDIKKTCELLLDIYLTSSLKFSG